MDYRNDKMEASFERAVEMLLGTEVDPEEIIKLYGPDPGIGLSNVLVALRTRMISKRDVPSLVRKCLLATATDLCGPQGPLPTSATRA